MVRRAMLHAVAVTTFASSVAGSISGSAHAQSPSPPPRIESVPKPHEVRSRVPPLNSTRTELVEFDGSPFPYKGVVPYTNRPFLDVTGEDGRRGHASRRGVLWEDRTFSDSRVLLHMPKGYDVRRPGVIVVFLHGNRATLERDVRDRQRVADQIAEANVNAVLVAPQLAVNASDSSAGKFWEPMGFAKFMGEASSHLARIRGDMKTRATFATMPIIIVAYSGGYVPAAWALHKGGAERRVIGVVLLDALYGEMDKYADFITRRRNAFFVSAYTSSTSRGNEQLRRLLADRDIPVDTSLPQRLPGRVAFLSTGPGVDHEDFVTHAWTSDPIRDVLDRLREFTRVPVKRTWH